MNSLEQESTAIVMKKRGGYTKKALQRYSSLLELIAQEASANQAQRYIVEMLEVSFEASNVAIDRLTCMCVWSSRASWDIADRPER
jgi:hypothetical protein